MSFFRTLLMFVFVFLQVGFSDGFANEEIIWEGTAKSFFSNFDLTITSKGIYKNRKFTNIYGLSDEALCTFGLTNFPNTTKIYYPKENNLWMKKIKERNISFADCVSHSISYRNSFVFKEKFVYLSDTPNNIICDKATGLDFNNNNKLIWTKDYDLKNFVIEAKHRGLDCGVEDSDITIISSKSKTTKPSASSAELEKEKEKRKNLEQKLVSLEKEKQKRIELEKEIAALKKEKRDLLKPKKQQQPTKEIGSGFYVSKFRHIVTNQHVVNKCKKISVGDSISKQIPADLIASDKRNDLAILQTISMEMASADTKSFLQNLSIEIVPIISGGLMRSEDVKGGEEIVVAGYPLGNMVSDTIKVTKGIVSATRGMDNNFSQFEIDAVIRKGNSGGPIYDKRGNIVGVAVSRLNVNRTDTINFGIKGSTVKQFLSANDVPTTWANRAQKIDTQDLYKIASKQTVMVVCHR